MKQEDPLLQCQQPKPILKNSSNQKKNIGEESFRGNQQQQIMFPDAETSHLSPLPPVTIPTMPVRMRPNCEGNARMKIEVNITKNLILSYFAVVKKNISDLVPKTIMAFLVQQSTEIARGQLVEEIYTRDDIKNLMIEDPLVAKNREQVLQSIKALRQAQNILNEATQFKY